MDEFFNNLGFTVAFVAGVLSFFAPCAFSIMPVYFAYITGEATHEKKNLVGVLKNAVLFAVGFMLFFVLMGFAIGAIGSFASTYADYIRLSGGVLIFLIGIFTVLKRTSFLEKVTMPSFLSHFKCVTPFLLGAILAFSSTPCIGPVIGAILTFSFDDKSFFLPVLYMITYTIGFMVPFALFGFVLTKFFRTHKTVKNFVNHFHFLSGLLLLLLGLIMIFDGLEFITLFIQNLYFKYDIPYIS